MEKLVDDDYYRQSVQNGIVKQGIESLPCALDSREYHTSPCLRFYRSDYLQEIGVRFGEGIIHEDEEFSFLTYLYAARVECSGDRLYQRRYRPGSTMTSKTCQASAHGYLVTIDGLLDVYQLKPHSEQEKGLLERYINRLIYAVGKQYETALRHNPGSAFAIKKDARNTLKRARELLTLSKTARLTTHSLFLGCLIFETYKRVRRAFVREEDSRALEKPHP